MAWAGTAEGPTVLGQPLLAFFIAKFLNKNRQTCIGVNSKLLMFQIFQTAKDLLHQKYFYIAKNAPAATFQRMKKMEGGKAGE